MQAHVIKTDGAIVNVDPKNGSDFQFEELRGFVHGYIEILPLKEGRWMILNEEGKLNNLPVNNVASDLALREAGIAPWDFIVGDVLICGSNQIK